MLLFLLRAFRPLVISEDLRCLLLSDFRVGESPKRASEREREKMCYCYTDPSVRRNRRPAIRNNWTPSRTVVSDFCTRYTKKVVEGKSRLSKLFLYQALLQLVTLLNLWPLTKNGECLERGVVFFTVIAFLSILVGELGRRHSSICLLMCYLLASNPAITNSLVAAGRSKLLVEVIGDTSQWKKVMLYLLRIVPLLLGSLLQALSAGTTVNVTAYMYGLKKA